MSGVALLPSLLPLLCIYSRVYDQPISTVGVVVAFDAMQKGLANIPLSICLSSAFPLFVFFLAVRRKQVSRLFALAFVNYVISILIRYLLAENTRAQYGNFGWTFQMALFFLFITAIEEFYFKKWRGKLWVRTVSNFLFLWHLVSGIYYFGLILLGYSYK